MILIVILLLLVLYLMPNYKKPRVISNFLSENECTHIIKKATDKLHVSMVSENKDIDKSVRDSETAWLDMDDPIVRRVAERCVSLTDRPLCNCEKLQVLRYKPGGYYKPHQDTFSDSEPNKRMYTVILALNDSYDGGETEFPNLKRQYKLQTGDALFFHTLDNYELMTSMALHGGKPVKSGEKWICNLWVHKHPYNS